MFAPHEVTKKKHFIFYIYMLEIEYVIQYEQNVLDSGDLKNVFPY